MFLKKKVFISHRRNLGQATTDAILVKECIERNSSAEIFMDVTEEYLGPFPKTLKEKIRKSDSFALVLPKATNYEYLCNPDNWVHKEIHYALTFNDAVKKPSRIVPIVFDRDFTFPSKERLGEIAEIADYSFIYFDTNSKETAIKLVRALGLPKKNISKIVLSIFALLIIIAVTFKLLSTATEPVPTKRYQYNATNEFVTSLDRFNTFSNFTDSCGNYVNKYLEWYLTELSNDNNPNMNTEFNEAYIKEYCIRLIVMAYLALSAGDIDKSINKNDIQMYIELCYNKIPESTRYPISIKQKSTEDRTQNLDTILDISIETLNSDPRIQSIPEDMLPILKATLKNKVWPL